MKTTNQTAKAVMTKAEELSAIHLELLAIASDTVTGQALTSKADGTLIDRFKRSATIHANDAEVFSKWAKVEEASVFDALLATGIEKKAAQGGVSSYRRNRVALAYYIAHAAEVLKLDDHIRLGKCKAGTTIVPAKLETISIARIERARKALEDNNNKVSDVVASMQAAEEAKLAPAPVAPSDTQAPALPVTLRSEVARLISEFGSDALADEVALAVKAIRETAAKAAKAVTA